MRARAISISAAAAIVASTLGFGIVSAPAASAETIYTLQDVQKHATPTDCWSIIDTSVYDLTSWIPRHEGGQKVIIALCGIDGTASFMGAHGPSGRDSREAARALARFRIGAYDTASANFADTTTYTIADVAKHATATDCWSVVSGKVYNLTNWVNTHPGGPAVIVGMCGIDGTAVYTAKHGTSASAAGALKSMQIGVVTGPTTTPTANKTYTMKQVRKHRTATNCWTVVGRSVYNVTAWIPKHPGGKATIIGMCGRNATKAFRAQHSTSPTAKATLAGYRIGKLR